MPGPDPIHWGGSQAGLEAVGIHQIEKETRMTTINIDGVTQEQLDAIKPVINRQAAAHVGCGVKFESDPLSAAFGPVVYSYTPAEAVAAGTFVRLPEKPTNELFYALPVVLTRAAYEDAVRWDRGGDETEDVRGYDVLWMAKLPALDALQTPGKRFPFAMSRIENRSPDGHLSSSDEREQIRLDVIAQPYNRSGQPCLTILLPSED